MRLIAITGGIGAGKSTVTRELAALGAHVIDADDTARRSVDPGHPEGRRVLAAISSLLGPSALRSDGSLDREHVATRVFADDALRQQYNAIVHPAIMQATAAEFDALRGTDRVVVHEIPLLTADSPPLPWTYDLVVTVEAAAQERLRRLREDRGYSAEHAEARVHAQGPEDRRLAVADEVLRTDGTLEETRRLIADLWARISE